MATLQSIRKHGAALVIVIGIALFAFIAGDAAKVLQPGQNSQNVGQINGKKIEAQYFQQLVEEYTQAINFIRGANSLTEAESAQVKDEVWNTLVTNTLIGEEAAKLGLTVTTAELQALINEGTDPMLAQSAFRNEAGQFDGDILMKFLAEYANMDPEVMPAEYVEYYNQLYSYWKFIESNLVSSLLIQKYEALVVGAQFSNPVAAEYSFNARNNHAEVAYAVVPYNSVADSLVKVSSSDIKKIYDAKKELYKQPAETRAIRYIDVTVTPSQADRDELLKEVGEYAEQLATAEDFGALVRLANSTVAYSEVPVTSAALPEDVVANLSSVKGDAVYGPYYNQADDTYNAFRILAKAQYPDSVQFRQIQVADADAARAKTLADSIYTAIKAVKKNANFAEIAEKYGQSADPQWIATSNFEGAAVNGDNATYLNTLFGMKKGELKQLDIAGGHLIIEVLDTKNPVEKYTAAVIKRPAYFSNETYTAAYNQLSAFVASNQTLEKFEANAEEAGFRLYPVAELSNAAHTIGGVQGTREALRWAFNAEKGEVSHIFEAGANDHLMVVAVADIHKAGYRPVAQFADMFRIQAVNDKKADKILAKAKKVGTMEEALALEGVKADTLRRVTFGSAAYVGKVPASEPIISGAAAGLEEGEFSAPIKGNGGVYFLQVVKKGNGVAQFNAASEQQTLEAAAARNINGGAILNELYRKGEVKDNRYLFF
ncbi:MAG: SurA N-terminal domain-containing protein [Bacteroidaceae bacterium]|nr:SurA N-terminal domain-containing protein [Bacteroidaceae bacterium]